MGGASKRTLIFLAFGHIFSTLSHLFSCLNNFNNQFALFPSISYQNQQPLAYFELCPLLAPIFLKYHYPLHFLCHSFYLLNTAHFRRHHLFCLFYQNINQSLALIPLPTSTLNLNLRLPTCFNHILYLLYLINTSFYTCPLSARQPLIKPFRPLVTLHTFSQNKTTRFVIQMKAKIIDFLTQKKCPSI